MSRIQKHSALAWITRERECERMCRQWIHSFKFTASVIIIFCYRVVLEMNASEVYF